MSARATILYVEDNPDNRTLVRRVLQMEGYQVVEAQNAAQAMERLQSESVDLALMDINMPDVDGYTLTAQIKAMPQFASIPIVAVTANVMRGDRERSLQAGCDGYIQKPIDIDTLAEQVERFLPRAGGRPAAALSNTTPVAPVMEFVQAPRLVPASQSQPAVPATAAAASAENAAPKVRRKRFWKAKPKASPVEPAGSEAQQPATHVDTPDGEGPSNG